MHVLSYPTTNIPAARFHVVETFAISSLDAFILVGAIVDGVVRAGMEVALGAGPGAPRRDLHSVEFLRHADPERSATAGVGLRLRYRDEADLAALRALPLAGATLDVWAVERRACTCCGTLSLRTPPDAGARCPVCAWPDDPAVPADDPRLAAARATFLATGVSDPRFTGAVRPPHPFEAPSDSEVETKPAGWLDRLLGR